MSAFSGVRRVPARRVRPSLRDPRFASLIVGQSVNSVGSWASAIVLWGFAAYRFNASPEAISVTVVCWSVPPAVLGPLTGALADRFGPRAMMIAGYLAAAAAALAMAAAGSLAFLDVMAAAYGVARSLSGPAASALPPRVVEADDLLAANSLLGVTSSIGQIGGPLAASVLLATVGFSAAFVADAATYLAGVIVLLPLPLLPLPAEPARSPQGSCGPARPRAVPLPDGHGCARPRRVWWRWGGTRGCAWSRWPGWPSCSRPGLSWSSSRCTPGMCLAGRRPSSRCSRRRSEWERS